MIVEVGRVLAISIAVMAAACGRIDFGLHSDGAVGDGAVGSGAYCSTLTPAPTFCEDFDRGLDVQKWPTSQVVMYNGTFAIDSSNGASPPASLEATTTQLATGASAAVKLVTGQGEPPRLAREGRRRELRRREHLLRDRAELVGRYVGPDGHALTEITRFRDFAEIARVGERAP